MMVIAGACRVSRFKSSFYLLPDRPGLNPIFVFIRARFPGDRSALLSLSPSPLSLLRRPRNSSKLIDSEGAVDNFFFFFLALRSRPATVHFRGTNRRRAKKDDVWDFISVKKRKLAWGRKYFGISDSFSGGEAERG